MPRTKILITGATGFIGSCLTRHLVDLGYAVRALVRENSPNAKKMKNLSVEVATGDVCQPETLINAAAGIDRVYHCAAIVSDWAPQKMFYQINVEGTRNVLDACVKAGVGKFIGINTNDVFGLVEGRVIDETLPLQKWNEPYPDTKLLADQLAWQYHRECGLAVTTVYPCWVYGVNDTSFLPHIVEAVLKKEMIFWRKNSLMWPVYIENLLDLLVVVGEDERAIGNSYLIHDGKSFTFEEFCGLVADELGVERPHTHIPYAAAYGAAMVMEGVWRLLGIRKRPLLTTYIVKNLGSCLRFSIDKAERELGWKPKISFKQGFTIAMQWVKMEYSPLLAQHR